MSKISLAPNAAGSAIFTIESPGTSTNRTLTLPDDTGTIVTNSGNQAGSFTTLNTSGAVVFNDAGADVDFRVEGDTDANLLFVDAGNDRVGVGTSSPSALLDVDGNALIYGLTVGRGAGNVSTNTAVGASALAANTNGDNNVAIGYQALDACTTGQENIAIGTGALGALQNTNRSIAIGYLTLPNATGEGNTAVGGAAGLALTTGQNNLLLGVNAGRSNSPSGELSTESNNVVLGDNSIVNLYCADTTISSSDARDKTDVENFTHGLDWITQLRPVTYRWDKRAWYVGDEATTEDILNAQPDGSKKRSKLNIGFLAQEELAIENQFGYGTDKDNMLVVNLNEDNSAYGLKYERLVPVLVNAIKELSAKNDALEARIAALENA